MAVQAGLALPSGHVLPGSVETTVVTRCLSPLSGLSMVIEYVMVEVSPGARFPVQVRMWPA